MSHTARTESGPDLPRHPYEEVYVVQDGDATFTASISGLWAH